MSELTQQRRINTLERSLDQILRLGEQHTPSATGRRIADFKQALSVALVARYPNPKDRVM